MKGKDLTLELFDKIHADIVNFVVMDKSKELNDYLKNLIADNPSRGILRTAWIAVKPIKDKEIFKDCKETFTEIANILRGDKKIGTV